MVLMRPSPPLLPVGIVRPSARVAAGRRARLSAQCFDVHRFVHASALVSFRGHGARANLQLNLPPQRPTPQRTCIGGSQGGLS